MSAAQNRLTEALAALKAAQQALPVGALAQTQITRAIDAAHLARSAAKAEGR